MRAEAETVDELGKLVVAQVQAVAGHHPHADLPGRAPLSKGTPTRETERAALIATAVTVPLVVIVALFLASAAAGSGDPSLRRAGVLPPRHRVGAAGDATTRRCRPARSVISALPLHDRRAGAAPDGVDADVPVDRGVGRPGDRAALRRRSARRS